jgi:hypothetical protein
MQLHLDPASSMPGNTGRYWDEGAQVTIIQADDVRPGPLKAFQREVTQYLLTRYPEWAMTSEVTLLSADTVELAFYVDAIIGPPERDRIAKLASSFELRPRISHVARATAQAFFHGLAQRRKTGTDGFGATGPVV